MPTATFSGDFEDFYKACSKAETSLKLVQKETDNVTTATKGATGGLTSMSGALKDVASALGVTFSIGAAVGAVVAFTKNVFAAADAIEKLAAKTGISVDEVMKLRTVAGQTSVSVETLATAANVLQANLADPKLVQTFNQLTGSWATLRAQNPYEALKDVGRAIADIQDPAERARVGTETLGKSWSETVASMSTDWDALNQKTEDSVTQQIAALNRLKNSGGAAWEGFQNEAIKSLGNIALAIEKAKDKPLEFAKSLAAAFVGAGITGQGPGAIIETIGKIEGAVRSADAAAKSSQLVPSMPPVITNLHDFEIAAGGAFQTVKTGGEAAIATNRQLAADYEKLVNLQNQIFGRDLITKAQEYQTALGGIGNVTKLLPDQMAAMNTTFIAAATHLGTIGQGASAAAQQFRALAVATTDWAKVNTDVAKSADGLTEAMAKHRAGVRESLNAQLNLTQGVFEGANEWAHAGEEAEKSQAAFYAVWDAQQKLKTSTDATTTSVQQLTSSFAILNQTADQWRAKAAQLYADAERNARTQGGVSFFSPTQIAQDQRAMAGRDLERAGRQETLDQQIAGMNAPWARGGANYSIQVNAMQGIDGDQIAGELVNGMRRRGIGIG